MGTGAEPTCPVDVARLGGGNVGAASGAGDEIDLRRDVTSMAWFLRKGLGGEGPDSDIYSDAGGHTGLLGERN